ncbi:MAG: telomere binding protein [Alyxoria varia]|nr:MAG: telomere binding protein [Alyxoria varia]
MTSEILREIGSSVAKLRTLLADTKKDLQRIQSLQTSLSDVLSGTWKSDEVDQLTSHEQEWKEFLSLVATGKVLSIGAQANHVLSTASENVVAPTWIGEGREYARWLGRGIVVLCKKREISENDEARTAAGQLCGKSFGIGYTDEIVATVVSELLFKGKARTRELQRLIKALARHEQRHFLLSTLTYISERFLSHAADGVRHARNHDADKPAIEACAGLLDTVTSASNENVAEHLSSWLLKAHNAKTGLYRVIIAVMRPQQREDLLERVWHQFSDKLTIKHSPIMQQDAIARILVLCIGAVHRSNPTHVFMLAHSSTHTSGVSDRLASSSYRARTLGMIMGTVVSQLVDKPELRMTFEFNDNEKKELEWFQSLSRVSDTAGSLEDLKRLDERKRDVQPGRTVTKPSAKKPAKSEETKPSKPIITVVEEDDEDDGLIPHAKPDTDTEDSDEDATVAQRNKPKAPVYVRDLLNFLQNTEDDSIYHLALVHGPTLIRRKADFGHELLDLAPSLADVYIALGDPFDMPDFHDLRQAGMVALLVSRPREMGPWFASRVFGGDYSVAQRVSVLVAMGSAGKELVGSRDDDRGRTLKSGPGDQAENFPSKMLPDRLHKLYTEANEMKMLEKKLEDTGIVQPVQTTRKSRNTKPKKVIRNDLAKGVADSFFFPLTGLWQTSSSSTTISKSILSTFIQTLALLFSAASPSSSSLNLPDLLSEFWPLLLALRHRCTSDVASLEAILFGFLTIFEVSSGDKRTLGREYGKEIGQTVEWVSEVFERLEGGGVGRAGAPRRSPAAGSATGNYEGIQGLNNISAGPAASESQEERCKMLAAGVLVAAKEVAEAWREGMLGGSSGV